MAGELLILGASVRAAAHSARRAGLRPEGGDLFADRDLIAVGPAHRVESSSYPEGLETVAASCGPMPWLYTGALENAPDLVDRIARTRPLWGNEGATLRAVRDPIAVLGVLQRAGLPVPKVALSSRGLPRDGSWLVKPLASAGGRGIRPLEVGAERPARPSYFQEWIDGLSLSALVLGARRGTRLLGMTWQWVGRPGAPFAYRGSIGPWPLPTDQRRRVQRLADVLNAAFGLVGLWGIDLILRDGVPWPVEVNPRYTASVEVLEFAERRALLDDHRRVFESDDSPGPLPERAQPRERFVGKAIVFAPGPCRFPEVPVDPPARHDEFVPPLLADIPEPGATFRTGDPVVTVFAHGSSVHACKDCLERKVADWERRLTELWVQ